MMKFVKNMLFVFMIVTLSFAFINAYNKHYFIALSLYVLAILCFFSFSYLRFKIKDAQENINEKYMNKGRYVGELLYNKFRSTYSNIDKDIYISEIVKLYSLYKSGIELNPMVSDYSCFCAYLDFEFYAEEYLADLPKL